MNTLFQITEIQPKISDDLPYIPIVFVNDGNDNITWGIRCAEKHELNPGIEIQLQENSIINICALGNQYGIVYQSDGEDGFVIMLITYLPPPMYPTGYTKLWSGKNEKMDFSLLIDVTGSSPSFTLTALS